jgi:hypothetical protein
VGFTNQKAAIEGSQAQRLDGEQKKISSKKERFRAKKKDFEQRKISIPQTQKLSPLHSIVRSETERLFIKILYVLDT